MSFIKRKRDQRDYELRRIFDQFARMPQRIVMPSPVLPDSYDPSHDRFLGYPLEDLPLTFNMPVWGNR